MKRRTRAVFLMLATTLFTSIAQVLYKIGSVSLSFSFSGIFLNGFLMGGLALYGIGAVLMVIAFRSADVSLLYPIIATSYIWVSLLSLFIFQESVGLLRWLGIVVIIFGIVFIGFGSKSEVAA